MSDEFVAVAGRQIAYCSVFELAAGSVVDRQLDWTPSYLLRQFRRIVEAAAALHRMGAVHRDITPMNVLLTRDERRLLLADFGIASHGVGKPVRADVFNAWYSPDSVFRERANWKPRDDVWQLGQLLAYLLDAAVDRPIAPTDVRDLDCSDSKGADLPFYRPARQPARKRRKAARDLGAGWHSPTLLAREPDSRG